MTPADRVRGELGVRVLGEMCLDEVAQLPGAGRRAARAACLAPTGGGFQQAAGLGGGGADGVHGRQRGGGGVPGCGVPVGGGVSATAIGDARVRRGLVAG
jgi:hypothetical protein